MNLPIWEVSYLFITDELNLLRFTETRTAISLASKFVGECFDLHETSGMPNPLNYA